MLSSRAVERAIVRVETPRRRSARGCLRVSVSVRLKDRAAVRQVGRVVRARDSRASSARRFAARVRTVERARRQRMRVRRDVIARRDGAAADRSHRARVRCSSPRCRSRRRARRFWRRRTGRRRRADARWRCDVPSGSRNGGGRPSAGSARPWWRGGGDADGNDARAARPARSKAATRNAAMRQANGDRADYARLAPLGLIATRKPYEESSASNSVTFGGFADAREHGPTTGRRRAGRDRAQRTQPRNAPTAHASHRP